MTEIVIAALAFVAGLILAWLSPYRLHVAEVPLPAVGLIPEVRLPGRLTLARIKKDPGGFGRLCYCPEHRWRQWLHGAVVDEEAKGET